MSRFIIIFLVTIVFGCASGFNSLKVSDNSMDVYIVLKMPQQSNGRGTDDATTALSLAAPYTQVRYWRRTLADDFDSDAFEDLDILSDGTYGDELALGTTLSNAGLNVAIIKIVKGSTAMNQWTDEPILSQMTTELEQAISALDTEFPGANFIWAGVEIDQGELEIRHAADSVKVNWTGFAEEALDVIEGIVGQPLRRYVILTRFDLEGAVNPELFRNAQLALSNARFVSKDDTTVLGDGVHDTSESQNIKGTRVAELILEDLEIGANTTAFFDLVHASPALLSVTDISVFATTAELEIAYLGPISLTLESFLYIFRRQIIGRKAIIIFVNNDLTAQIQEHLIRQLFINIVYTGDEFDTIISTDSDYKNNVNQFNKRILVIRPFNELHNRELADAAIFIKEGMATVETDKYGPPGKTWPLINLHMAQIISML